MIPNHTFPVTATFKLIMMMEEALQVQTRVNIFTAALPECDLTLYYAFYSAHVSNGSAETRMMEI